MGASSKMVPKRNRAFNRPSAQQKGPSGDLARRGHLCFRALHDRHHTDHDGDGLPRDFIDND